VNRRLQLSLGLVISAVAVWFTMKDVRLAELLAALARANYLGFAAAMFFTLAGFWMRAVRWRSLLLDVKPVRYGPLFSATMIGFMANNLLPLRLGEFVRAWALGRRESISKTTVFATVVVERVVDMIALLMILGITLLVHPISESSEAGRLTRRGAMALVVTCVALTVVIVALEKSPRYARAAIALVARPLPLRVRERGERLLAHFLSGLSLFRDLGRLTWVMVLSFVMFGMVVLGLHVSLWAMGIEVPWYGGLVMLVITAIGIMVPAAPGYIGTMNLACVAGLALFGVPKVEASSFSWFYWASQYLPITVVGLYYLRREGLSLRQLGDAPGGEEGAPAVTAPGAAAGGAGGGQTR
jgi:uncharacterized protein (TIRG00374 family)